jgi:hypothetical protein
MKTAMQELKESLQSINERYELKGDGNWLMNEVLDLVDKSLEKEKEQMQNDFESGMGEGVGIELGDLDYDGQFINYYNQTYNQNE